MVTFITPMSGRGTGPRLAVKDAIDVEGVPTTAGSRAVLWLPSQDAPVVQRMRAGGAQLVGKTNLTELCRMPDGVNPHFGTPVNPLDRERVPGGSSSGSAVALASGEADMALGTDTGGSIRIPAACCGVWGLKPTHGLLPLEGVFPFAPSLDVVGPMAASAESLAEAMRLLLPGFKAAAEMPLRVGRVRVPVADRVEVAVDAALRRLGVEVRPVEVGGWEEAARACRPITRAEGWDSQGHLLGAAGLSPAVNGYIARSRERHPERLAASRIFARGWRRTLLEALVAVDVLALPTLVDVPPTLVQADSFDFTRLTFPVNLAGLPALAVPLPGMLSLQVVAPPEREDVLVRFALEVERAAPAG